MTAMQIGQRRSLSAGPSPSAAGPCGDADAARVPASSASASAAVVAAAAVEASPDGAASGLGTDGTSAPATEESPMADAMVVEAVASGCE